MSSEWHSRLSKVISVVVSPLSPYHGLLCSLYCHYLAFHDSTEVACHVPTGEDRPQPNCDPSLCLVCNRSKKLIGSQYVYCLLTWETARGDMPPADVDHELDDLVRKNIRLHEAISSLTDGSSSDSNMSITQGLELLSALRAASASSPDTISNGSRHASSKVQRNPKRNKLDHASNDDTDSIADSPKPSLSSGIKDRLGVGSSSKAGSRSTSVGAGRETSVKVEDGNDSMDSVKGKVDGLSLSYRNRHRKPSSKG